MSISLDYLVERKRNKSQLMRWKLGFLLMLLSLLLSFSVKSTLLKKFLGFQTEPDFYIASIAINDVIEEDSYRLTRLKEIAEDNYIKAVIVNINSPGGSVVGSEMLYNSLIKISANKPVVVLLGSVAASGAYLVALGGDYIISHNGTITGSIGVIMQSAEITELLDVLGIKFSNFKSSPLKASPNLLEKVTPEVAEAVMENINDVYNYFITLVATRRNLEPEYVKIIADGRVYTGSQALALKLVDVIGNQDTALKWLQEEKKIPDNMKIVEVDLSKTDSLIDKFISDFNMKIINLFPGGLFSNGVFLNRISGLQSII